MTVNPSVTHSDDSVVGPLPIHGGNRIAPLAPSAWAQEAACRNSDPDALFVQGAAQNRAKRICGGCSVRTQCLVDALDNKVEFGVWGGMTERERRSLLRRRPDVDSWQVLLADARRDFDVMSAVS